MSGGFNQPLAPTAPPAGHATGKDSGTAPPLHGYRRGSRGRPGLRQWCASRAVARSWRRDRRGSGPAFAAIAVAADVRAGSPIRGESQASQGPARLAEQPSLSTRTSVDRTRSTTLAPAACRTRPGFWISSGGALVGVTPGSPGGSSRLRWMRRKAASRVMREHSPREPRMTWSSCSNGRGSSRNSSNTSSETPRSTRAKPPMGLRAGSVMDRLLRPRRSARASAPAPTARSDNRADRSFRLVVRSPALAATLGPGCTGPVVRSLSRSSRRPRSG